MIQSPIATAADYADAMLTARKARSLVLLILALLLIAQLALFCTARFSTVLDKYLNPPAPVLAAATLTAEPATAPAVKASRPPVKVSDVIRYGVGASGFLALIATLLLCIVLLLLVKIMLVGRLIGVSHVTAAFLWSVLLALFLFPWQAFLNNQGLNAAEFKIPGVLYTFDELLRVKSEIKGYGQLALYWARFMAFPVASLIIMMIIHLRSSRGLRLALGEAALSAPAEDHINP